MNLAAHHDALQALNHLASVLPTPVAAVLPASAVTTQYGADGKVIRANATTSFADLKSSPDGKLAGGSISHETRTPEGALIDSSTLSMLSDGRPGKLQTVIQNRFAPGPFKHFEADLSALQWTAANSIYAGTVAITTRDAATNAVRMEGQLAFDQETLRSGTFAHRAWAGDGQVHGYTHVDYTAAELVGMRLVGGQCAVTVKNAALKVLSLSTISISNQGTVTRIATQTFDPASGKQKARVAADFSGVRFDPRGQIAAGTAGFVVTTPQGAQLSRTTSAFEAGVCQQTITETFVRGSAQRRIVTDYTGARFNNDLQVVNSDVVSKTYDAAGQVLSITTTSHDAQGKVTRRVIERLAPGTGATLSTTVADYSGADFDTHGAASGGSVILTTTTASGARTVTRRELPRRPGTAQPLAAAWPTPLGLATPAPSYTRNVSEATDASGALVSRTVRVTRPDGKLLEETVTTFEGQRPVASKISRYGTDGKTLLATSTADLTKLAYDPATGHATGTVGVAVRFRGVTPSENTTLSFGSGV